MTHRILCAFIIISGLMLLSLPIHAQQTYEGYAADNFPAERYPIALEEGQIVTLVARRIRGDLAPMIQIERSSRIVAETRVDDPAAYEVLLAYRAQNSGQHIVTVSSQPGTTGSYRLTMAFDDANDAAVTASGGRVDIRDLTVPEDPSELVAQTEAQAVRPATPDWVYTGYMSGTTLAAEYTISLEPGQALIATARRSSGVLDSFLRLRESASGAEVASNDNLGTDTQDAEIIYISELGGDYVVSLSSINDTYGDFRLEVSRTIGGTQEAFLRTQLSGETQFYDTPSFRVHYTLEGVDAAAPEYAKIVGDTMEEIRRVQIVELGWPMPPNDSGVGGDNRYDVYLIDLEYGLLGYAAPEMPAGDNPNTSRIETNATASHLVLDNDYDMDFLVEEGLDPIDAMRTTAAHEFNHSVQFSFDLRDQHRWYYESTAMWVELLTIPDVYDATRWVEDLFDYPEVCFGVDRYADPTYGGLAYSYWMFWESIADTYGNDSVLELWDNIAVYEGWQPLEELLLTHRDTVPDAVARFHIKNLARDYDLADLFEDKTVYLEGRILRTGTKESFVGVQELGSNFYELLMPQGQYNVRLTSNSLYAWMIGIRDGQAEAFWLERSGNIDTTGYEYAYLMVFNPVYDDNMNDCVYSTYAIEVQETTGRIAQSTLLMDAAHFIPLK